MSDLKDSWKSVGHNFSQAWKGLGKSIVKSVSVGAKKADKWANSDNPTDNSQQNQQNQQNVAPQPNQQMVQTQGVETHTQDH